MVLLILPQNKSESSHKAYKAILNIVSLASPNLSLLHSLIVTLALLTPGLCLEPHFYGGTWLKHPFLISLFKINAPHPYA